MVPCTARDGDSDEAVAGGSWSRGGRGQSLMTGRFWNNR
jgi:hypothetical protein